MLRCRSITNCPVFQSMLTQENKDDIERIQKVVLRIILEHEYKSYEHACRIMGVETLEKRRNHLSLSFALKCCNSKQFEHLFPQNSENMHEKFVVPFAHTSRYQNSPKVSLARLLNNHFKTDRKDSMKH